MKIILIIMFLTIITPMSIFAGEPPTRPRDKAGQKGSISPLNFGPKDPDEAPGDPTKGVGGVPGIQDKQVREPKKKAKTWEEMKQEMRDEHALETATRKREPERAFGNILLFGVSGFVLICITVAWVIFIFPVLLLFQLSGIRKELKQMGDRPAFGKQS